VLVHGSWHGAWCWDAVVHHLEAADARAVAVDLPSVSDRTAGLADDADRVRAELDEIEEPVLLVGTSYGGAVITDAGIHPRVERLVFLSAFPLEEGESVSVHGVPGGEKMTLVAAIVSDGEVGWVDPTRAVDLFYHDCPDEVAAAATARLRPQSLASRRGTPRAISWREKPSTFILCTDDHCLVPSLQRNLAARVGPTIEMATSHSPFLSRPAALAAVLADLASA
jgi:pimeloyl-ACP methyl ester carboxylesterase